MATQAANFVVEGGFGQVFTNITLPDGKVIPLTIWYDKVNQKIIKIEYQEA